MNPITHVLLLLVPFYCVFAQPEKESLSLNSALEIGLKNNPEIKSSRANIQASRGRFLSALAPTPTDLSITHDYVPAGQNVKKYGEKTIGISQSFDFPTNYVLRGSKFSLERKIAENDFTFTKLTVVSNVKRSYYNAVGMQEQVRIALENLSIAKDFVEKAEIRHTVGESTSLEKLMAKVNYSEALNNVEVQKNHLSIAVAQLNLAMGRGKADSKNYSLCDTLSFIPLGFTLDQLTNEALRSNPQLQASNLRLDSYTVDKSLAWSSILPNFNLGYFSKEVRDDATRYYGASISIGIPLWFMLDQRGKVMEASSNVSMAKFELQKENNALYAKTQAAYAEFQHEENQIQLYVKEILPQAQEIFRTAAKSYEVGEITYIEFLQAQQTLTNSKARYTEALLSYNLSIVAIEESIGKTLE